MIACGRDAPERRRASRDRIPRRVLAARSCARGGDGRQTRPRRWKRRESAEDCPKKAGGHAGPARIRWRVVADCEWELPPSATQGARGGCAAQASRASLPLVLCSRPLGRRSGRQTALAQVYKPQMALDRRRDYANVAHESLLFNQGRLNISEPCRQLT
jgi:hypothetical protein